MSSTLVNIEMHFLAICVAIFAALIVTIGFLCAGNYVN